MSTRRFASLARAPAALLALVCLAVLSACGGGGTSSGNSASKSTIQSVSANGAMLPGDSSDAQMTSLKTAQAVVALEPLTVTTMVTINCLGGGSAVLTRSGTVSTLGNGLLDAGESYTLVYSNCKGSAGAASVNGTMTLAVTSASAASVTVNTTTNNVTVALPLRTVTLNGSSTLVLGSTTSVTNSGTTTKTTQHWTTPGVQVKSQRNVGGPLSIFNFVNVDLFRTIDTVNGVIVGGSSQGSSTLEANLLLFTWRVTLATIGLVTYGPTGVVTQGSWLIDLPDDRITVTISNDAVSVAVDYGADGKVDVYFYFLLDTLVTEAG